MCVITEKKKKLKLSSAKLRCHNFFIISGISIGGGGGGRASGYAYAFCNPLGGRDLQFEKPCSIVSKAKRLMQVRNQQYRPLLEKNVLSKCKNVDNR